MGGGVCGGLWGVVTVSLVGLDSEEFLGEEGFEA